VKVVHIAAPPAGSRGEAAAEAGVEEQDES
jgi:hypothetical protein